MPPSRTRGDNVKELRGGDAIEQRIANAIESSLDGGSRSAGQPYRVFVLFHPEDDETVRLSGPVLTASGRTFAWTMSQRYTRPSALTKPGVSTTTELEAAGG